MRKEIDAKDIKEGDYFLITFSRNPEWDSISYCTDKTGNYFVCSDARLFINCKDGKQRFRRGQIGSWSTAYGEIKYYELTRLEKEWYRACWRKRKLITFDEFIGFTDKYEVY